MVLLSFSPQIKQQFYLFAFLAEQINTGDGLKRTKLTDKTKGGDINT